jgi:hypothetical protein
MKKISTPYMGAFKIFPYAFFGFIAIFLILALQLGAWEKDRSFVVVPGIMAVAGWFFMKTALSNLMDEVFDCGEYLLVRRRGMEERVALADIINVDFTTHQPPARITLTLARPGPFGSRIAFAVPARIYLHPVPRSEIADELIARAHAARSAQR